MADVPDCLPVESGFRRWLALALMIVSVMIILGLGITSLLLGGSLPTPEARTQYAKDLLGILLPVASAWMGTIIAYYFSRENFEAASRSTQNLVKQLTLEEKLKAIPIAEGMIPLEKFDPKLTIDQAKPEASYKLKADLIDARLEAKHRERLPILDGQDRIVYIVHRSLLDKFIVKQMGAKAAADLTLADLSADADAGKVLRESFRTLKPSATLADAKYFMDTAPDVRDVFVTADGTPSTKVVGWVTNVIMLEKTVAKASA